MENQMDLANMSKVESPKIDVSPYVGKMTKIETVEPIETQYGTAIKVSSKVLDTIEIEGKDNIVLTATRIFSISKEGEIVIGSKLYKFLEKQKVEQPTELVGTAIQVLKNEKDFLTF